MLADDRSYTYICTNNTVGWASGKYPKWGMGCWTMASFSFLQKGDVLPSNFP